MVELVKDTKERNLGRHPHICRVCGTSGKFESYLAREMMQNKRDEFEYFVCNECNCLQIAEVPENLSEYYGKDYYSFNVPENPDMQFEAPIYNEDKILDVGCGSGAWLVQQAQKGYGNLFGCDPFLEKGRHYGDRVKIYNCSIHEMEGTETFDIIRMSDSFEHVTDPLEVLLSAKRLLKQGGGLVMTIPTYPNIAFEMFGPHWYQLDAPRHIFLHSIKSLQVLEEKSGLHMVEIKYNSNRTQFVRSFLYERGIPFWEQTGEIVNSIFKEEQLLRMDADSLRVNEAGYGDHMQVIWTKLYEN